MSRDLRYYEAINEATDLSMATDPAVYVMGLGVPDPKGVFGTTLGLREKYGPQRVLDMPTSENGMTGVALGSALVGMRPIMVHQRMDFAVLAMEQLVNQAAKWHYMYGGQMSVPLVVRMIVGRGWGQGPQHSQSLQAWFAHVPGLKVVMPATPYDAKGLLISSIRDNNPVMFIEHRWLHNITGHVPEGTYQVPLGQARRMRTGSDVTIAATSYMTLEAMRAADLLEREDIHVDVIDIRSIRPLDEELILESVRKTGHLVVADTGWKTAGISAEIVAIVTEKAWDSLRSAPARIGLLDGPIPSTPALARHYYPRAVHLTNVVKRMLGRHTNGLAMDDTIPLDIPDRSFTGPF